MVHISPEIRQKPRGGGKFVAHLGLSKMLMIALAALVIVAEDADAVGHQGKRIFKIMPGPWNRVRHAPNPKFNKDSLFKLMAFKKQALRLHVGVFTNKNCCCQ